jgi:hypothetical protein
VSFEHLSAIRKMQLPTASKAVLTWAAWHACRGCGIAWAGPMVLGAETCMGERTVRRALNDLVQRRLIVVVGYRTGGRGRATEYLVVPDLVKTEASESGYCQACGKTHDGKPGPRSKAVAGETPTLRVVSPRKSNGDD